MRNQSTRTFFTNSLTKSASNSKRHYLALASGVAAGIVIYSSYEKYFAESNLKDTATKLFEKYATGKSDDNQKYMTEQDLHSLLEGFPAEYITVNIHFCFYSSFPCTDHCQLLINLKIILSIFFNIFNFYFFAQKFKNINQNLNSHRS